MAIVTMPANLLSLHAGEEDLRAKAITLVQADTRLLLHFQIAERAMDVIDVFRQSQTDDEDINTVQLLGLRIFNALASAIKLMLGGYAQTSAQLLRDAIETVFLLGYFRTNRPAIKQWREATPKQMRRQFRPDAVRKALDARDGFNSKRRAELYSQFSELAGHPTPKGFAMLRPNGMDAHGGPFLNPTALKAVASEMGRLAVQVGEQIVAFYPARNARLDATATAFDRAKNAWITEFYPKQAAKLLDR